MLDRTNFSVVVAKNSIDFVRRVFECNKFGTPVLMSSSIDDEKLSAYRVEETYNPADETGWARLEFSPRKSDELAQISFTSGTEGTPKAILLTHANQADAVERLKKIMRVDSSIREYIGIPVYHSFGFGRCRLISSVGGEFYVPPNGFDCAEIQRMLANNEINAISAVPSLWRVLLQNAEIFGEEAKCVKWIEIGSQYMAALEKAHLKKLFPNAIIVQHYGLTEASRSTFLEVHAVDGEELESVGKPIGDTEIKIAEDGTIHIRGSVVAREMIKDGVSYQLLDADGWFATNDLGELRHGYLFYKGRKDDMINCGGVKLYAEAIENELRKRLFLSDGIACTKFAHKLRGEGLLIAIDSSHRHLKNKVLDVAEQILKSKGVAAKGALRVEVLEQLPVTNTGKIQRTKILELVQANSSRVNHSDGFDDDKEYGDLKRLWCEILGLENVSIDESFNDVGGDSLTAISVIIRMKKLGVSEEVARGVLQGATIRQIVDSQRGVKPQLDKSPGYDTAFQIKVVRGLLVLVVIFAHWSGAVFERLPESMKWLQNLMAPVFSSGTPGFAIMYGVAIGFSFLPLYQASPERLLKLVKAIALLLFAGVFVLGILNFLVRVTAGEELNATHFFNGFYSVLTYYLLITISLPLLFKLLTGYVPVPIAALLGAVVFHLMYLVVFLPMTKIPSTGVLEFAKLLISAKYSYFNMTGGVLLGVGVGFLLFKGALTQKHLVVIGALLVLVSILLSIAMDEESSWWMWPSKLSTWRWALYLGLSLLLMNLVFLLGRFSSVLVISGCVKVIATIGMLAFPFYVMHELVLPFKGLLLNIGVPYTVGIIVPLTLFIIASVAIVKRSKRLMFD